MPRLIHKNPSYREHRASGQAIVTIDGKDIYLGPHGTKASRDEYDRIIGEWLANGRRLPTAAPLGDLSVAELVMAYWQFAQGYFASENAGELRSIRLALRELRKLYGRQPVASFGPLALKAVREQMLKLGWCRGYINGQVRRVRRAFKWGVEQEMVHAHVLHALQAVTGLKRGKTDAPESPPVRPVPDAHVDAILPHVSPQVEAMIQLQRLTGMRPAEVCIMRGADIDTTGRLWTYRPAKHKTEGHGHERTVYLGPKAQEIVKKFLKPNLQAYLFSPKDAEEQRRKERHEQRTTPLSCGNVPGSNRRRRAGRKPGERYSVAAYRRAIARACGIAFGMPAELHEPQSKKAKAADTKEKCAERRRLRSAWHDRHVWHPHQLRHNAATSLRKEFGLEAAQVILGHKNLTVTEIYAEKNVEAARRIMAEVG